MWTPLRALALLPLCLAAPALAENPPANLVTAELIGGWPIEGGTMGALKLTLAPGWKTYWRSPGEAGIPPAFDWRGSSGLTGVTYHWPRPAPFNLNGIRTFVYHDTLILPIAFQGDVRSLGATVDLGVCRDICVPAHLTVTGNLSADRSGAAAIKAALRAEPDDARGAGYGAARCATEPTRDGLRLTADIPAPKGLSPDAFAVIETGDPAVWVAPVRTDSAGGRLHQIVDLVPPTAQPFALDRSAVRFTIFDGAGGVHQMEGCTG